MLVIFVNLVLGFHLHRITVKIETRLDTKRWIPNKVQIDSSWSTLVFAISDYDFVPEFSPLRVFRIIFIGHIILCNYITSLNGEVSCIQL